MIVNNVKLVLENEVVDGSIEIRAGEIRAFAETQSRAPEAMDGEGAGCCRALSNCTPIIWINSLPRVRKSTGQLIPQ